MNNGTCRIIGGKWRGRKVSFDDAEGLRPTTDRIRETLFNWLQPYVTQSVCLDCFAGSGVLALEAISRGAAEAVLIESNTRTVHNLKAVVEGLKATETRVIQHDFLQWIRSASDQTPDDGRKLFDLVFLDPPFHHKLLSDAASSLENSGILADDAIIYVEQAAGIEADLPSGWHCLRQKTAGKVSFQLFQRSTGQTHP